MVELGSHAIYRRAPPALPVLYKFSYVYPSAFSLLNESQMVHTAPVRLEWSSPESVPATRSSVDRLPCTRRSGAESRSVYVLHIAPETSCVPQARDCVPLLSSLRSPLVGECAC